MFLQANKLARRCSLFLCVAAVILLAGGAQAADLAVLRNGFTIRHEHRQVIGDNTRLFLSSDDSSFTDIPTAEITGFEKDLSFPAPIAAQTGPPVIGLSRSATNLTQVVNSASATYHLDPDLVNSVIHAESGFNAHARSPKGAQGLMQLMPSTASALGVNDAFDPQANVGGGSRYLRELLERYNFDLVKALAAYNAGPQRVEQYQGVPPFHETRAYVARIVHEYNRKKIAQERAVAQAQKQATNQKAKETRVAKAKHAPAPKTAPKQGSQVAANASSVNSPR